MNGSPVLQQARASDAEALDGAMLFSLREAIARAGEAFAQFRSGTGTGGATPPWDAVVLTCATESQAAAAREELARRRVLGLFPPDCELLALPDPPRRVGSGGATLLALETLAARWLAGDTVRVSGAGEAREAGQAGAAGNINTASNPGAGLTGVATLFARRRVLLIHSGGESQRMPAYAALGKIFAPLPVLLPQAVESAIFDWLYLLASALPGRAGEVTLLSGDVVPVFNPLRVAPSTSAVRGVALPVPAAVGEAFGVYVPDAAGQARRILQKPDHAQQVAAGAIGPDGRVAVDTGLITLRSEALHGLLSAAGLNLTHEPDGTRLRRQGSALLPSDGGAAPWDLYRDWLPRLAAEPAPWLSEHSAVERNLASAARGITAGVASPDVGAFIHLGTTRDFHDAVVGQSLLRTLFPFTAQRDAAVESGAEISGAFVGRSLLSRQTHLAPGAVVDHCRVEGTLEAGTGSMVSGVEVPAGAYLRVAPHRLCYQTLIADSAASNASASATEAGRAAVAGGPGRGPARGSLVTVVLGLDDNPKLGFDDSTFQGQPLRTWLATRDIAIQDVWDDLGDSGRSGTADQREASNGRTLWEARLFVHDAVDPDRAILGWLQGAPAQQTGGGAAGASGAIRDRWLAATRYSLRDLLDAADAAAIAYRRGVLVGDTAAARVAGDVQAGGDESFAAHFSGLTEGQRQEAAQRLRRAAEDATTTPDALHRARYWRILADLVTPEPSGPAGPQGGAGLPGYHDAAVRESLEDGAAACVREAVSRPAAGAGRDLAQLREARGRRARVAAPVRIDFGGGWTDTPPFSLERGGAVLNAAITLNGELPLFADAEVIDQPRLYLESDDLSSAVEVRVTQDVAGHCDPTDAFALHKACLVLMGLLDPRATDPLAPWRRAGVGLRVRTGGRIPRGSGLGTSSIVGAALLRALGQILDAPQDDAELSRQTLELEQVMTTGGGWQDQMGAIAPGVKLISTEPGLDQRPIVEQITFTAEQRAVLEAHLVVAYTGHHRLAKNILRQVVMRYLGRDPLAMQALYQLRGVAGQLQRAVAALDLELFGTLVNQVWLLNKTLDPQTSYPAAERLFSALAPHVYGAKLVGAGGGGFFFAITRQPNQRELVADVMARDREFAYGYVVDHQIWDGGLQVEMAPATARS